MKFSLISELLSVQMLIPTKIWLVFFIWQGQTLAPDSPMGLTLTCPIIRDLNVRPQTEIFSFVISRADPKNLLRCGTRAKYHITSLRPFPNFDTREIWIFYNIIIVWFIPIILFATVDVLVKNSTYSLLIYVKTILPCSFFYYKIP